MAARRNAVAHLWASGDGTKSCKDRANCDGRGMERRLTTGRMLAGLSAAAVAGLLAYIALSLVSILIPVAIGNLAFDRGWNAPPVLQFVLLYATFGLPLSLILSLGIGYPIWKRAEARPLRSRRSALLVGGVVGGIIGLLFLMFSLLFGLQTHFDDQASFDSWQFGIQVTRDGLPTLAGWLFQVLGVLEFMLAGSIGGLAARWVAFFSKSSEQQFVG